MNFANKKDSMSTRLSTKKLRCSCGSERWFPRPAAKSCKPAPVLICVRCGREQTVSRTTYAFYRYLSGDRKVGQEFRELYDMT